MDTGAGGEAILGDRASDPNWYAGLPRAGVSFKGSWAAIYCLRQQRRADGTAPVVLKCTDGEFFRVPILYDILFELALRHLHLLLVPGPSRECSVQALLEDRARHALKRPTRFVAVEPTERHLEGTPGNATTESPRGAAPEERHDRDPAERRATTESPRGAHGLRQHPAEDVDVASAAVDAGVMPATVHADGAKATEPGAPPETPDVPPETPDVPPEIPDASALPDYSESPRCCRSPWAPCGSRGERPSDSRGRHGPSDSRGRCGPSKTSDAGIYLPQLSEDDAADPRSLPGVALAAPQGAPEMSQSSSRRHQRHLRRRARKMALRAAP